MTRAPTTSPFSCPPFSQHVAQRVLALLVSVSLLGWVWGLAPTVADGANDAGGASAHTRATVAATPSPAATDTTTPTTTVTETHTTTAPAKTTTVTTPTQTNTVISTETRTVTAPSPTGSTTPASKSESSGLPGWVWALIGAAAVGLAVLIFAAFDRKGGGPPAGPPRGAVPPSDGPPPGANPPLP